MVFAALLFASALTSPLGPSWRACVHGEPDAAIAGCGAIIAWGEKRSGYRSVAHYNRANAYFRKAQFERANSAGTRRHRANLARAVRDYSAAIRRNPALAEAWINRGIVRYDLGDFTRAIADASEAIRLRPALAEAWNNRALAYHRLGRYDLAKRDFDETIRLEKNYGNALINRAMPSLEPSR